jgi:hypothetical protein
MVLRRVLFIGDDCHSEFVAATRWLAENSLLSVATTHVEAIQAMQHPALPPELVVVAQVRPDQFARADIEAVHRLAPLARLAVLAGSWCEGEIRTGHPWPGVLRLYWHQAAAGLRDLLTDTSPLWTHPRTATDVERLLNLPTRRSVGEQKLVAIGTETSIAYQGLAATLVQAGYATLWIAPRRPTMLHGAAAGIWDESQVRASPDPLRAFAHRLGHAPIVALVNFPRLEDYRRLHNEGVSQLIAKPFLNTDLIGVLQHQLEIVSRQQGQPKSRAA